MIKKEIKQLEKKINFTRKEYYEKISPDVMISFDYFLQNIIEITKDQNRTFDDAASWANDWFLYLL